MSVWGEVKSCRMRGTSPPASCSAVPAVVPSSALGTSSNTCTHDESPAGTSIQIRDCKGHLPYRLVASEVQTGAQSEARR